MRWALRFQKKELAETRIKKKKSFLNTGETGRTREAGRQSGRQRAPGLQCARGCTSESHARSLSRALTGPLKLFQPRRSVLNFPYNVTLFIYFKKKKDFIYRFFHHLWGKKQFLQKWHKLGEWIKFLIKCYFSEDRLASPANISWLIFTTYLMLFFFSCSVKTPIDAHISPFCCVKCWYLRTK